MRSARRHRRLDESTSSSEKLSEYFEERHGFAGA
jgi:hypothetical protein